jgi:YD repeat-containing protein
MNVLATFSLILSNYLSSQKKQNMKNILNFDENLELFDGSGTLRYKYCKDLDFKSEWLFDHFGNVTFHRDSNNFSESYTYDANGNEMSYKNSNDFTSSYTRDRHGNELIFKNSNNYISEYTRDDDGNEITYKSSNGARRGFSAKD